jgi:hypothetical protein
MQKSMLVLCLWSVLACEAAPSRFRVEARDSARGASDGTFVYGNPNGQRMPAPGDPGPLLNPSNQGLNPRVVDGQGAQASFPLKPAGAQLHYGDGRPMTVAGGGDAVRATDSVFLNYGMRKEVKGQTFFMAWQTNRGVPTTQGGNATGWISASDMADEGAGASMAVPHRLGNVPQALATDPNGNPITFVVNGQNAKAMQAAALDLTYRGFHGHMDRVTNFFNLHDGRSGIQMLVNLTNVPGGGIAEDCLPNGTTLGAAKDAANKVIVVTVPVFDRAGNQSTLDFIYGSALGTWGWVVKDWLDPVP